MVMIYSKRTTTTKIVTNNGNKIVITININEISFFFYFFCVANDNKRNISFAVPSVFMRLLSLYVMRSYFDQRIL